AKDAFWQLEEYKRQIERAAIVFENEIRKPADSKNHRIYYHDARSEEHTSITNLGTDALSWDDEEGAFSASHGTSGTNKITNVAAGEIAS
ncbi:hypothetical protein ONJ87_25230, partial [Salmonella enterica subsp. enterica serovar Anatum]|nr:hypothetical protein [Salmonella enterica subsp. enterica serovar Anatum]